MLGAIAASVVMLVAQGLWAGSVHGGQGTAQGAGSKPAQCQTVPREHDCKGLFTVYYHDAATGRCAEIHGCYARVFDSLDQCRALCETAAQAPAADAVGESPSEALFAYLNAGHGDPDVVRKYLAAGADPDHRDDQYHITLLHNAAHFGRAEAAQVLIGRGARVNARNREGNTPLYAAAHEQHAETVRVLLDAGAEVNVQNAFGYTPLRAACWARHRGIVRLLLAKGADVNAADRRGHTPLHVAVDGDDEEIVEALIERGASLHAKDRGGMTPVDRARRRGNGRIIAILNAARAGSL